jgi:hypothetical protein
MNLRARRLTEAPDVVSGRLADEAITAYVEWREECEAVRGAYRRWSQSAAAGPESVLAFAAYGAALDHEERAASLYGDVIARWRRALWPDAGGAAKRVR